MCARGTACVSMIFLLDFRTVLSVIFLFSIVLLNCFYRSLNAETHVYNKRGYKKSLKIPKGGNQNLYIEKGQTTQ